MYYAVHVVLTICVFEKESKQVALSWQVYKFENFIVLHANYSGTYTNHIGMCMHLWNYKFLHSVFPQLVRVQPISFVHRPG